MECIKATEQDVEQITALVQETIKTIYPKYYPKEVVDFLVSYTALKTSEKMWKTAGLVY